MQLEKYLVFFIKKYKMKMKIVYDFCFNANLNDCFFDVFDINKSFTQKLVISYLI